MGNYLIVIVIILSIGFGGFAYSQSYENLNNVNTLHFSEYAPSFTKDGKTMIFQSDRTGAWRLYESTLHDNIWSDPRYIEEINDYEEGDHFIGGACISYDGQSLYFTSDMYGSMGSMDIFYCKRMDSIWSEPINLSYMVNSKQYDAFPSVTEDNSALYFVRIKLFKKQGEQCYTIYCSHKDTSNLWQKPVAVDFPINLNCEDAPKISPDGLAMLFSSIRRGGKGRFDLYESKFDTLSETWSEPRLLEFVSTEYNDRFAYINKDLSEIFYTNNGGFSDDIYYSEVPDYERARKRMIYTGNVVDKETGEPIVAKLSITNVRNNKIVKEVYTDEDEGGFEVSIDAEEEYLVRVSVDEYVLYEEKLNLYNNTKPAKEIQTIFDGDAYERTKKTAIVSGNIVDKETGEPIVAKLSITNVRNNKIVKEVYTQEEDGGYEVTLDKGESYEIYATAKGLIMKEPIEIKNLSVPTIIDQPMKMEELKKDVSVVLNNIYFDFNSAALKEESFTSLQQIVYLLTENTDVKVEISAHTDNVGEPAYNLELSQERANSVVHYLIDNGIKQTALVAKGYGETKPLVPNDTDDNRAKNRRVEFRVIKFL